MYMRPGKMTKAPVMTFVQQEKKTNFAITTSRHAQSAYRVSHLLVVYVLALESHQTATNKPT